MWNITKPFIFSLSFNERCTLLTRTCLHTTRDLQDKTLLFIPYGFWGEIIQSKVIEFQIVINYANLTALKSHLSYFVVCIQCNLKTSCLHCAVYDKTTSAPCLFNVPWTFLIHVSSVPTFVEIPGLKCFLDSCSTAKARGKSWHRKQIVLGWCVYRYN